MSRTLPKIVTKSKKRIGRGMGSGKGSHTVGKGQKGQKTRGNISVIFEGVKVKKSLIKRLPFKRGKDKFKSLSKGPVIVDLGALDILPKSALVNLELLIKSKIVDPEDASLYGVKILGNGNITKPFTILVAISKSAAKKVEKAGGKVENGKPTKRIEESPKKLEDKVKEEK